MSITDEKGNRTAVVISLEEWGALWEDIYDLLVLGERKKDPNRKSWKDLKAEMDREATANNAVPR